jgi:hypothetical protein
MEYFNEIMFGLFIIGCVFGCFILTFPDQTVKAIEESFHMPTIEQSTPYYSQITIEKVHYIEAFTIHNSCMVMSSTGNTYDVPSLSDCIRLESKQGNMSLVHIDTVNGYITEVLP